MRVGRLIGAAVSRLVGLLCRPQERYFSDGGARGSAIASLCLQEHRVVHRFGDKWSSRDCARAASAFVLQESTVASRRAALACCYICHLTIHSSRPRFVASFERVVVRFHSPTGLHVAGRLNSSVRPHRAGAKVWRQFRCCGSVASAGFGSCRWLGRRAPGSSHVAASGLRFRVRVPTLLGRDCS